MAESQTEKRNNQSPSKRIFENNNDVNKTNQSEKSTFGQSEVSKSNSRCPPTLISQFTQKNFKINREVTDMDRETTFYHWGATREAMEIIRKRIKRPETRRLMEQRNTVFRPGTLRRR